MCAKGLHCTIVDYVWESESGVQPIAVQLTNDQFKNEMASANAAACSVCGVGISGALVQQYLASFDSSARSVPSAAGAT